MRNRLVVLLGYRSTFSWIHSWTGKNIPIIIVMMVFFLVTTTTRTTTGWVIPKLVPKKQNGILYTTNQIIISGTRQARMFQSNGPRLYSSTTQQPTIATTFEETPLGKNGKHLMDGLDHYIVPADGDGHPLSVYGIDSAVPNTTKTTTGNSSGDVKPILLLHGRTWSSVPVYHLLGGPHNMRTIHKGDKSQSRSLMEALLEQGLQPYCMDFRGFGGTPPDATGGVEPYMCVQDAETVLQWIMRRHGMMSEKHAPPTLLGWSQGALIAQLAAQKPHPYVNKVILYGSIYDPLIRYPREPLYRKTEPNRTIIKNQFDGAIEDFTVEGTIPPEPARHFAEAALLADPVKAVWKHTYQFNNCDPARVHVPCLVVAGDQDPYAPLHVQQELFCNLGRASDRTWSILSGSDHAVHMLDGRHRLINIIVSFVMNGKRTEQQADM